MLYFIRTYDEMEEEHFQAPRTPSSVRRSLDGTLCVLAFDEGTEPTGWTDGVNADAMKEYLRAPEHNGVWHTFADV